MKYRNKMLLLLIGLPVLVVANLTFYGCGLMPGSELSEQTDPVLPLFDQPSDFSPVNDFNPGGIGDGPGDVPPAASAPINHLPVVDLNLDSIVILATHDKTEPLWIDFGELQDFTFANLVRAQTHDPDGTIAQICLQGSWEGQADCRSADVQLMAPLAYFTPYLPPGSYTLTLSATDNSGATASDTMIVDVFPVPANNQPPVAVVTRTSYTIIRGETLIIDPTGVMGDSDPLVVNMGGSFDPDGAIYKFGGCTSGDDGNGPPYGVSCLKGSFVPGTFIALHTEYLVVGTWSAWVFAEDITATYDWFPVEGSATGFSNFVELTITVLTPPTN